MKIFVSHADSDKDLAFAFVVLLEGYLNISDDDIRCTSVPGYALQSGDPTSATLRRNLQDAVVVVGLLTPNSVKRPWILFELGAGWGMEKRIIPLLDEKLDFSDLPGPLIEHHAVRLNDRSQLEGALDLISKECNLPTRNAQRRSAAVTTFLENLPEIPTTQIAVKQPVTPRVQSADPVVRLEKDGKSWKLVLENRGPGVAKKVSFKDPLATPGIPLIERELQEKLPIAELPPHVRIPFLAPVTLESASSFDVIITWEDEDETPREKRIPVAL